MNKTFKCSASDSLIVSMVLLERCARAVNQGVNLLSDFLSVGFDIVVMLSIFYIIPLFYIKTIHYYVMYLPPLSK